MFNRLVERQGDKRSQQRWRADAVSFFVRVCWLADWAPRCGVVDGALEAGLMLVGLTIHDLPKLGAEP